MTERHQKALEAVRDAVQNGADARRAMIERQFARAHEKLAQAEPTTRLEHVRQMLEQEMEAFRSTVNEWSRLQAEKIRRIILVRPAVEAGERLAVVERGREPPAAERVCLGGRPTTYAVAPGRARISAAAGPASDTVAVEVVANTIASIEISTFGISTPSRATA